MTTHDPTAAPSRQRPDLFERVATRIGDLDHPFYHEERDRDVWNEASAVGFQALLWGLLLACTIAIWVAGAPARPYVVVGMLLVGAASVLLSTYATRRGVDGSARELLAASRGRLAAWLVLAVAFAAGLITDGGRSLGPFDLSTVAGMLTGAGLVLAVMAVMTIRARRRAPTGDDDIH